MIMLTSNERGVGLRVGLRLRLGLGLGVSGLGCAGLFLAVMGLALCFEACALAQVQPRIGYLYPAGGTRGDKFKMRLGGQNLTGITNVLVSGEGVKVSVLDHVKPLSQKEFNLLRDQLEQLQAKRKAAREGGTLSNSTERVTWTAADEKTAAEIRDKIARLNPRKFTNPAISETLTLQVEISADARVGQREMRVWHPVALSNPMAFCVSPWPEILEKESAEDAQDGNERRRTAPQQMAGPKKGDPEAITLPAVINGQIMPGDVDRFRFRAQKGQKLVFVASARNLIPYLPDAVPGWFQATLGLYDSKGKEVAYDDDFRFHPDPVLYCEIVATGDYVLEIKDSIFRGREDFVYRVECGELPFVTGIFPLGCQAGQEINLELRGWNLVQNQYAPPPANLKAGLANLTVPQGTNLLFNVPFQVDTLPEALEKESSEPQAITAPVIISGRIDRPGDVDVFSFQGRAGDEIVAEVTARRLNSPLDSRLRLTDASGKEIAANDDFEDKGAGLTTHHADSLIMTRLPADGRYLAQLSDSQGKGGPEYAYRLRISAPRPDFELRVVPSSLSIRGGSSATATVYALRKDGFTNEIAIALADAPAGFSLSGARVPANSNSVKLTLAARAVDLTEPCRLSLEGRAIVAGNPLTRPAVPAEDMMQAFFYRHLVPAAEWRVVVNNRGQSRTGPRILSTLPVKIPAGGTAKVQVATALPAAAGKFQFEVSEGPEGITVKNSTTSKAGVDITLEANPDKVKPGQKGNLILRAVAPAKPEQKKKTAQGQRRPALLTLPAIPFEVTAQ